MRLKVEWLQDEVYQVWSYVPCPECDGVYDLWDMDELCSTCDSTGYTDEATAVYQGGLSDCESYIRLTEGNYL